MVICRSLYRIGQWVCCSRVLGGPWLYCCCCSGNLSCQRSYWDSGDDICLVGARHSVFHWLLEAYSNRTEEAERSVLYHI